MHRYDPRMASVTRSVLMEDRQVLRLLGRQSSSCLGENLSEDNILAIRAGGPCTRLPQPSSQSLCLG